MLDLGGQTALVTGGTSGIGAAIVQQLAERGARVLTTSRTGADLASAQGVESSSADLGVEADVDRVVSDVLSRSGKLDILIHNAAGLWCGPLSELPLATFDELYRVNVRAVVQLTQKLLPLLIEAQGQLVFINSSAAQRVPTDLAAYSATKYALRALTDGWRLELNRHGVRVLSVFCGRVATPMQNRLHEHEGKNYRPERLLQPSDIASCVMNALTLPRTAEVTDLHLRPMVGV